MRPFNRVELMLVLVAAVVVADFMTPLIFFGRYLAVAVAVALQAAEFLMIFLVAVVAGVVLKKEVLRVAMTCVMILKLHCVRQPKELTGK